MSDLILAEIAKLRDTIATVTNLVTEVRIEQTRQRDVLQRVEAQVTATNGRVGAIETREAEARGRAEGRRDATRTVAVTWKAVVAAAGLVGLVVGVVFQIIDHL